MKRTIDSLRVLPVLSVTVFLLVCLAGCGGDDEPQMVAPASASLELAAYTLPAPACNGFDNDPDPGDLYLYEECLEFSLKYDGRLVFYHSSAKFNCCSDSIDVVVNLQERNITITEREISLMGGCDCDCPVDLEYEVAGIEPALYTITVIDPYRCQSYGYLTLQFAVDLAVTPTGSFCVDRCVRVAKTSPQ